VKGNSSNIHVSNIVCYESGAMCIGSLGSNPSQPEYVDNIYFDNITLYHSSNAAWIKTYPGTGHVKNVTFRNIKMTNVNQPIYIIPCIYSGQNCDGSHLQISDITWENISGTARYNVGAGMHCSSAAPCQNLKFKNINITTLTGGPVKYLCSNIADQSTMGLTCTGTCPASWPQQLSGNA
jgi:galacturan 1,4-alpha-galacturonidase